MPSPGKVSYNEINSEVVETGEDEDTRPMSILEKGYSMSKKKAVMVAL